MISQDTFIVGKSKFRQCLYPKCFYAASRINFCPKHTGDGFVEPVKPGKTIKAAKALDQ